MADAPTALPGGELRVRRVHRREHQENTCSIQNSVSRTGMRHTCATDMPPPAQCVSLETKRAPELSAQGLSTRRCRVYGPSRRGASLTHVSPLSTGGTRARKSIPTSPPATKSNHTCTPLATLLNQPSLVLLPPAIPHHSNNSPLSPLYTTPSHHLPPPQYSSTRLPFPPAHPTPNSNNSQASLATLLTHLSVVLLPPAIPHHSNNSPLSPCYTTPSHHLAPPQYSSTRLPFPPGHPTPNSNNTTASLATLLTHSSLVLLPPAIPHHSNNSPLSPCYTTPSHHLPPPQYSSTRLAFPPGHPTLNSNNTHSLVGNTSHPSSLVLLPPAIPHHSNNSPLSPCYTTPSHHLPPPSTAARDYLSPQHTLPPILTTHTASLATLLTHFSLVLLPPAIPHHSNNSPLSPCYTTPSHHLAPPPVQQHATSFPPRHTLPSILTTHTASLATLLTHFSLVLLPPAIPHHSNNSPLNPCYTTPATPQHPPAPHPQLMHTQPRPCSPTTHSMQTHSMQTSPQHANLPSIEGAGKGHTRNMQPVSILDS